MRIASGSFPARSSGRLLSAARCRRLRRSSARSEHRTSRNVELKLACLGQILLRGFVKPCVGTGQTK